MNKGANHATADKSVEYSHDKFMIRGKGKAEGFLWVTLDAAMKVYGYRALIYNGTPELAADSIIKIRRKLFSEGVRFDETPNSIMLRNGSRIDFAVLGEATDTYEDSQADGA